MILTFVLLNLDSQAYCQNIKYEPKGNPEKWNFEITPFLLLPTIQGNVESKKISEEVVIGTSDFIKTLKGAFMFNSTVSKDKFFISPSYIFTDNEVEKIIWTSNNGNRNVIVKPELKKNIFELISGVRIRMDKQFILDPYVGFRYTNYNLFGTVEGNQDLNEFEEKVDFWDPVIGMRAHYYPWPRFPIELRADVGGFGIGSKLTWTTMIHSGYSISPLLDVVLGFAVLSNKYESENITGNTFGMTSLIYGVDMGIRFYLPKRYKDPDVFSHSKP